MLTVHGLVTVPTAADVLEVKHHNGEEVRGQKEYAISYDFGRGLVVTVGGHSSADKNENIASDANPDPLSLGQRDLLAQERMSHWTKYLGIFTGAGVVLLLFTLHETNETAKYARDMLDEQRRTDELTLRAYLTFEVQRTKVPQLLILVVKNVGQTPALNVALSKRAYAGEKVKSRQHPPPPTNFGLSRIDGLAIAPSASITFHLEISDRDDMRILQGDELCIVYASASYHDEWTYRSDDEDEHRATRQFFTASGADYMSGGPLIPVPDHSGMM
ncbi:MAG: hypothetical protein RIB03_02905 [Henriciella sp.]|uniref:hypothetical protein n=1 Tax=Henriciella sp. TaxID=1968823 RepID=UPI0032EBCA90